MPLDGGLVGYWPLLGDAKDRSGFDHHGVVAGVAFEAALPWHEGGHIEVPNNGSLLVHDSFTVAAMVFPAGGNEFAPGDVLSAVDPATKQGWTLGIHSSAGGYSAAGSNRLVHFDIAEAGRGRWHDRGRPNSTSNYVSNSLTVFRGRLYAATTDGARPEDRSRVYRWANCQTWEECGKLGPAGTTGVGPMIVHDDRLFAATWSYDWTRVTDPSLKPSRVYRYESDGDWTDCGQPGQCRRLFGLASFRGDLYVTGDDARCYRWDGAQGWEVATELSSYGHPLAVHDGRLFVGTLNPAFVYAFDGRRWECLGNPANDESVANQIHSFATYRGRLHASTWPNGMIFRLEPGKGWVTCGRPGESTEVNALAVHRGALYAGTIPRAEVYRYAGGTTWVLERRFHSPPGWEPVPVGSAEVDEIGGNESRSGPALQA